MWLSSVEALTVTADRLAGVHVLRLLLEASPLVKAVILLLLGFSVVSWAVIAMKWRELRRADEDSAELLAVYRKGEIDETYKAARELDGSPLSAVFLAGYGEMHRMLKRSATQLTQTLEPKQIEVLARHIRWIASEEALRLERGLGVLATTGSTAPFIGLFGTVVGIINAFTNIAATGAASLAIVAPGIAEALIVTAIGLFAAIPATIFYNYFLHELRGLNMAIDLFTTDFEADFNSVELSDFERSDKSRTKEKRNR